jgi:hypothetical protein
MSSYFLMITMSGRAVAAGLDPTFFNSCTVLANSVNAFTFFKARKLVKTWVYSIEWDLDTEQFVIKMPKNILGGLKEERV